MLGASRSRLAERLARARAACARLGLDGLVVTHLPNVAYLANFDGSAGVLALTGETVAFATDGRYQVAFESADPAFACPGLELLVGDSPREAAAVEWLTSRGARRIGYEVERLTVARLLRSQQAGRPAGIELVPTSGIIEGGRLAKDEYELGLLREAGRRLSAVAVGVLNDIRPGLHEHEVAMAIEAGLRRAGFSRPAFDTIVASGPGSAMPHARAGSRRLVAGDLVVLDFGGVYGGYCVDLTRTVRLEPVSADAASMYDAVVEAQAAAIRVVGPGVATSAVDRAARTVLEDRGFGAAFVHGTGHGLGLEVHEAPRIARAGAVAAETPGVLAEAVPATLSPGVVFTIEPGAYVAGVGGVRVEDDVAVTPEGCEVLTTVAKEWRIG